MSDRGRSRTPKSLTPPPHSRARSTSRSRSPRKPEANGGKGYRVIVVSGLSKNVLRGHLEEIFGEYGRITGVDLPLFKVSGLNRGKAAIEFDRPSEAQMAVKHMDGGQLDGSFLSVQPEEDDPSPAPVRRRDLAPRPDAEGRPHSPAPLAPDEGASGADHTRAPGRRLDIVAALDPVGGTHTSPEAVGEADTDTDPVPVRREVDTTTITRVREGSEEYLPITITFEEQKELFEQVAI